MPTDFRAVTMALKSQKCSQTKQYVIEPRLTPSRLRAFDQTKLFDSAMVLLYSVSVSSKISALIFRHFNQTCCPMLRVAVCVNCPKHSDKSESREPNNTPQSGNENLRNWFQAFFIRINFPIRFKASQEMPTHSTHQFQIFKSRIPTIEADKIWFKSAIVSFEQHFRKMVVFGFPVCVFIKNSIIRRDGSLR